MDEQTEFVGGPIGGRKSPLAGMAEIVAVPVDTNLAHVTRGEPFALALYRRRADDLGAKYYFARFEHPGRQPFKVEFADGPNQGTHLCSQPPDYFTEEVLVPLMENEQVFNGNGEPSAVAIYKSKLTAGKWQFHLDRIEGSGDNIEKARLQINEHRTIQAMNCFYSSPNYSIYTKPPTGKHPQVFIDHGHRRAYVDEKMAPLVRTIWEIGLETLGSCQELPSGKAYIGFPLARQGTLFHEKLIEAGIESKYEAAAVKLSNPDSGDVITVDSANVSFSPDDMPRIIRLASPRGAENATAPTKEE